MKKAPEGNWEDDPGPLRGNQGYSYPQCGHTYRKSDLIEEAYEATDFFSDLGKNGRWLRFTAAVIRDSRGELVGAVETLEDITEQKLAENALKKSTDRKSGKSS